MDTTNIGSWTALAIAATRGDLETMTDNFIGINLLIRAGATG
ncbi:hypothetical protein [Nostoc sp. ChiVER01]|nr:hypothetical protein [Nostoc sp. ChiVER01]MDZ8221727.1 hypothetical protein [Nostoc sp. ChiVER01]